MGGKAKFTTLTFSEDRPPSTFRGGVHAICIEATEAGKPDCKGIDRLFSSLRNPEQVLSIKIESLCKMRVLPDLSPFSRLRDLVIGATKIGSGREFPLFRHLRTLELWSSSVPNVSELIAQSHLETLILVRDKSECLEIHSEEVELAFCKRLREILPSSVEKLTLQNCNNPELELIDLQSILGLKEVTLMSQTHIGDFNWVAECEELERITVTANALRKTDFSGLLKHERPLVCEFYAMRVDRQFALAKENSNLVLDPKTQAQSIEEGLASQESLSEEDDEFLKSINDLIDEEWKYKGP